MNNIKGQFPIFNNQPKLVYLDSGATTLKPRVVLKAMDEYYHEYSANIHRGICELAERATLEYEGARAKVAGLIGGQADEVIFTGGTTGSINLVARGWGERMVKKGDEIVITTMEHHSNLVPWQELAKRAGAKLKFLKMNADYSIDLDSVEKEVGKNTKLVAMTMVSNVVGTVNPVTEIAEKIKRINPETAVLVDAAQAVAHLKVDVAKLGVDFLAFSAHKMYGPTGVGALWVKKERQMEIEPVNFGGGMISRVFLDKSEWADGLEKFEGGTPPIAEAIGFGAAAEFLIETGFDNIESSERNLADYVQKKLSDFGKIKLFRPKKASGIFSFDFRGVHPHDVATVLAREKICVRSGHHCAMPLHEILRAEATVRVSLGIYNTLEDIDKLIAGLEKVRKLFGGYENGRAL